MPTTMLGTVIGAGGQLGQRASIVPLASSKGALDNKPQYKRPENDRQFGGRLTIVSLLNGPRFQLSSFAAR